MKNKLLRVLSGESENHILPFFWQHGEADEIILEELHRIHASGVGAVCIESRPHDGFVTDSWWEDVRLIFDECRKLGMEAWILDDKYFPTGYCNAAVPKKHPELCKRAVTERHMDICGPITDGSVIYEGWAEEDKEDTLLAIIACRCIEGPEQHLSGECIDLTDKLCDGLVSVTLPDGLWRVFFIFERPERDGRVDFTNPESCALMVSEIYGPHYDNLKEYFGNTFKGFFSDEPFIMDHVKLAIRGENSSKAKLPWNKYILEEMRKKYGENWKVHMPALWFTMNGISPAYKSAYMDSVSTLYKRHFGDFIGSWCREHGVQYVGHVVEDFNQHSNMNSGAHYFRALDGQDMAGIDVVLHQIVPGMTNHPNACNCWYDVADPDLFHFTLAKLAASHSHIQDEKMGRALCEIYGAYGWAEGLKMMKWLTDHMLVRGINNFVPHAFSAMFPDEVPPQFTGAGHNPQEKQFRLLMEYMNRICTINSDGYHVSSCAILYHAEAEWSGGQYMYSYVPAKALTLGHIDFDIISCDYLAKGTYENGKLKIGREAFPCIVVPYSEYLPAKTIENLKAASRNGVDVIFLDKITKKSCETPAIKVKWPENSKIHVIPADDLVLKMRELGYYDVTASTDAEYLRYYHYTKDGTHAYMLTNEGITDDVVTSLSFEAFNGGDYVVYYPMENKAYLAHSEDKNLGVFLRPYESVIAFFGDIPEGLPVLERFVPAGEDEISPEFDVKLYHAENFGTKSEAEFKLEKLCNIASPKMFPRFGGFITYDAKFNYSLTNADRYVLDLGAVGETAQVYLNGKLAGVKIVPPYKFDISSLLKDGENELRVVVTNNLAYEQRDLCSKYLVLEPVGLLGPIKIKKRNKIR